MTAGEGGFPPGLGLRAFYERVLSDFFPRWSAGRRWRVRRGSLHGECGRADLERRTIWLGHFEGGTDIDARLAIHEICHAVTYGGHEGVWRSRMGRAAATARKLGRPALAELLEMEITSYQAAPKIRSPEIYGMATDAVAEGAQVPPFTGVVKWIGLDLGMGPAEVRSRYPRLRRVYLAAVARRRADERLMLRFGLVRPGRAEPGSRTRRSAARAPKAIGLPVVP